MRQIADRLQGGERNVATRAVTANEEGPWGTGVVVGLGRVGLSQIRDEGLINRQGVI